MFLLIIYIIYIYLYKIIKKLKLLDPEDKEQDMANSTPTLATTSSSPTEVPANDEEMTKVKSDTIETPGHEGN